MAGDLLRTFGSYAPSASYGAALCGLTSAVIVTLTLGTDIDPVAFAGMRAADNVIGISCALLLGLALRQKAATEILAERSRTVISQALRLIADVFSGLSGKGDRHEHIFLISMASLVASSEDAAAGSLPARGRLKALDAIFASSLDLIVVARATRSRIGYDATAPADAILRLKDALLVAADEVTAGKVIDIAAARGSLADLKMTAPELTPLAHEMEMLLERLSRDHAAFEREDIGPADRLSPHPDWTSSKFAALRGRIVVAMTGAIWLTTGIDAIRFVCLAASIFTVLFSAADEPSALVRQILVGAMAASIAAIAWRFVISPVVTSIWIGIIFTVPFVLVASIAQARQGTMFSGLAFNMLFAVQARAVDLRVIAHSSILVTAIALLVGIAVSYASFRWLVPMSVRRRNHRLRAMIRREIAAIASRSGTPWSSHHMGRLRYLVFSVAVRSRGQVHVFEHALAAMTLGHIAQRLGDLHGAAGSHQGDNAFAGKGLELLKRPILDSETVSSDFWRLAKTKENNGTEVHLTLIWLFELAATNIEDHGKFLS